MIDERLPGCWELLSAEASVDGQIMYPYGEDAHGRIMFDGNGAVTAQVMDARRPAFAKNDPKGGTPEEIKAAFEQTVSYYGRWSVNTEQTVLTTKVEGSLFPNWEGGEQQRFYSIEGDMVSFKTPPTEVGGKTLVVELKWKRHS